MKMGICVELGITLVIIRAEELSLEGLQRRIPPSLPRRDLTGYEMLTDYLDEVCRKYRHVASRGDFAAE